MKRFLIVLVLLPGLALAQDLDDQLGNKSQSNIIIYDSSRVTVGEEFTGDIFEQDYTAETVRQQYAPPKWETRKGVEEAAKAYFLKKEAYNRCKEAGDKRGMEKLARQMKSLSRKLSNFKEEQKARDEAQNKRLNNQKELLDKHEKQLNGDKGVVGRLGTAESDVATLQREMDAITPSIASVDRKFNAVTWWLLVLTLIVIIGFTRRYWLPQRGEN